MLTNIFVKKKNSNFLFNFFQFILSAIKIRSYLFILTFISKTIYNCLNQDTQDERILRITPQNHPVHPNNPVNPDSDKKVKDEKNFRP